MMKKSVAIMGRRRRPCWGSCRALLLLVVVVVVVALLTANPTSSFQVPTTTTTTTTKRSGYHNRVASDHASTTTAVTTTKTPTSTTALEMAASPLFSGVVLQKATSSVLVKKTFLAAVAFLAVVFRRRILWPGAAPDKSLNYPLPPGSLGCPFFGSNFYAGSTSYGWGVMFTKLFAKLGRPKLFKFYGMGMPFVSVTGKSAVQTVLNNEFGKGVGTINYAKNFPNVVEVFGTKSILYENDRDKHAMLRRIVGVAMTPPALKQAMPTIQKAATDQVSRITTAAAATTTTSKEESVNMHTICNDYTLDVAWRQILGLDLVGDEVEEFYENTRQWMKGVMSLWIMMPFKIPGLHRTKTYKAKEYLVGLVEKKLDKLDRDGKDGSTLSNIYFATDEDGQTRLSREEVIHNALILILAGSETSSSTLVNSILLLGLHKDVLKKLQQEQETFISKYGSSTMTKEELDEDCPYLDAFIRETMRIRPLPAMEIRQTEKSIILDGQQIPKNWYLWCNVRATHDQDPACRVNDTDDHMDLSKGFQPERWLNSETKPSDWMSFGEGARRCLGARLAMTEMKVFLATFVRNVKDFDIVDVSGPEDVKWMKISAIPYPQDGVNILPKLASGSSVSSTKTA